jgi:hypothetical protein
LSLALVSLYSLDCIFACLLCVFFRESVKISDAFYMRPIREGFGRQPVGHNTLDSLIPKMMTEASISGFYTLHSLRATSATRLYENGFPEQTIMEITGHSSTAVREYKRTSDTMREQVSTTLRTGASEVSPAIYFASESNSETASSVLNSMPMSSDGDKNFASSTPKRLQLSCGTLKLDLQF